MRRWRPYVSQVVSATYTAIVSRLRQGDYATLCLQLFTIRVLEGFGEPSNLSSPVGTLTPNSASKYSNFSPPGR